MTFPVTHPAPQYAHVTEAEAEEMKHDPLYHTWRDLAIPKKAQKAL
jgi:hypothetical protein